MAAACPSLQMRIGAEAERCMHGTDEVNEG